MELSAEGAELCCRMLLIMLSNRDSAALLSLVTCEYQHVLDGMLSLGLTLSACLRTSCRRNHNIQNERSTPAHLLLLPLILGSIPRSDRATYLR